VDLESAGAGMGTGLISAILVAFGLKQRIDRLEESVVFKDSCEKCEKSNIHQFVALHDGQSRIEGKIDTLLINLSRRREDERG
jgi:hypothetical protein